MAKPKAMMWYPEKWKADPHVALMSSATRNGYREIIDAMWLSGGSLPDDDHALFIHSRMTAQEWKRGRDEIRARLKRKPDGTLTQGVTEKEYERTTEILAKRSEAGKAGAHSRWQTHGKRMAFANGNRNAVAMQTETETETETEEEFPNGHSSGGRPFFADESYREFADAYRPLKDYGLNGPAPMQAYSEQVASPNGQEIHQRIMAGVKRMAGSGKARQYFPTAENFLKNQHYLDAWAPESNRPKSALGRLKDKLEAANAN